MKKQKYLIAAVGIIIGLILLLLMCRLFWLWPLRVSAGSMEPTVRKGGLILVNRLAYLFSKPKRGDVVFLDTDQFSPDIPRKGKWWMKRVIAVPGDRVSIRPPYIYINGKPLKDPPIFEKISSSRQGYAGYSLPDRTEFPDAPLKTDTDEITLETGEVFLIGDNTPVSLDSRHFGPVDSSSIIGKVIYVLAPGDKRGPIE